LRARLRGAFVQRPAELGDDRQGPSMELRGAAGFFPQALDQGVDRRHGVLRKLRLRGRDRFGLREACLR
jgi:hypothetical protein